MVRETRYLYVGNLPDSIIEERILDLFSSYGKIQGIKILSSGTDGVDKHCAIVAFMDIKSASKAQESEIILDGQVLFTHYNESSMTVTVQTEKKESFSKQHSPGESEGILAQVIKSKNAYESLSLHSQLHSSQKVLSSNVQSTKYDESLNKPLGMLFQGFPTRSTDSSIRDGLYHDYKKYGKVLSINVIGQGDERHAIVSFKKAEDAAKALEASHDKRFFGAILQVFPHEGLDVKAEFRQQDEQDEYHPKASRTLFVGNLDRSTTKELLRDNLSKYGYIIDIDIKNQSQGTCYAFIQFDNIRSVVQALKDLEDEHINNSKVKVGFGKSMPTTCVWIEGISDTVSEKYLALQHLSCYGCVSALYIDRKTTRALAYYDNVDQAFVAVKDLKGRIVNDKRIQVDFASRDCQNLFLDAMEQSGQLRPGDRPEDRLSRGSHSFEGCEFARQWSFDPNQTRNRFFPYEGPSIARGGYAGRPYFQPGRAAASRLPFYDGFEQRRENCLGARSSFKTSFEQLYEKDSLALSRNIKERSLSLERQRSMYRGLVETSGSRDGDIRYSEEWDLIEEREPSKKSERKRTRHHHKEKSPVPCAIDAKIVAFKKKVQSPMISYTPSLKRGKRPNRMNNDALNSNLSHQKIDENIENWIDVNLYPESEKNKCRTTSPQKHIKPKDLLNSKCSSRKHKNYTDDSSCSSSISSSDSLISLNSESGESMSKSSDEVDVLVKKKQELIKMLEAMEEDAIDPEQEDECDREEDDSDDGNAGTFFSKEIKDQKVLSRSCSDDSDDKLNISTSQIGTENSIISSKQLDHKKKCATISKVEFITSPTGFCNMKLTQDESFNSNRFKCSKRENLVENQKEDGDCSNKNDEVMENSLSPNGLDHNGGKVLALTGELNFARAKSENDFEDVIDTSGIEHCNEQLNIDKDSINDNEGKSCEPRNVDKSKKVKEVMSLPLPRFAFDLPSLRRRISIDGSEKSEDSSDRKSFILVKESIRFEVPKSPTNILSEEEDSNKVISNHKCECTSDAANSLCKSAEHKLFKASEMISGEDLCFNGKSESVKINTDHVPAPSKSITLDFKRQSNDDFVVSVLDDLKLESGDNLEDDTSLEERIRALDEKLSRIQQGTSKICSSGLLQSDINQPAASTTGGLDYREKYKRHRKDHGTSNALPEQTRTEPSDLAKILLSRSSIFDQDTQRLEMLDKITQNNNEGGAPNFNDNSCYYTCASQPDQSVSQNATSNLYSGLKTWASNPSMTSVSGLATKSSLNHMSACNVPLTTTKGCDAGQKVHPDNPLKMPLLGSYLSGDPRRIARPLEFVTAPSKPSISVILNDDQISQFGDSCDTVNVSQMTLKPKEAVPPVSILKKQGMSEDNSNILMEASRSDVFLQDHSVKRKSDISMDAFSKQPGKILMVDSKPESVCNKASHKLLNAAAGNSLTKNCNKALSAKALVKSHNMGQLSKNKNVLNRPIISERKSKLADGGNVNMIHKKEFEGGSKSGCVTDLKAKENTDGDERVISKEKNKPAISKPTFDDAKDDSDKKSKSLMKNNLSSLDTRDSKKDAKSISNISKNQKIPLKSKSLQEVQAKKVEDLTKDKTHGDKSQPVHKSEKITVKQKLTPKTGNDEAKDLRTLPKSSVLLKDEKKTKVKLAVSSNRVAIQETMKKCTKPNVTNSSSKDKKPEEKREVKALLQELGSNEEVGAQYVSMYDMVKRRSNKEVNVSKGKEDRTKSLKCLKAPTKRCPSRKTSLRLSSNDSDSNADCSTISKLKSRKKCISSSSSDVSSSSFSGEDDKDVITRKSKKKTTGFFRSLPTKRRIFSDSSSDESNQDMSPKQKKFLSGNAKFLKPDSKMDFNNSPSLCVSQNLEIKIAESLSGKDDLLNSTQSSASEDLNCSESKNITLHEKNVSSYPYIEKDLDLSNHPVPQRFDEQAIPKNSKCEVGHESEVNDQPSKCLLEFQERSNDKESSIDTKPKEEVQNEKLDIRDCFSDDALLEQMDDDSYVTTLPGFEETSFRVSKENKMQNEISSDSFSGILVDNVIADSSKQDAIHETILDVCNNKKDASISNVDSLSNKSCQESEVSEPVFDDVDTDNNTEELDLAIKSLFRDGEELKFDQVSLPLEKKSENIVSDISNFVSGSVTCDTISPSSALISKESFEVNSDIPTSEIIKQNVADIHDEMLNIERSETTSEKAKDNFRENSKPKEFSGHFISTFKPEQSQEVGQAFRCEEPALHGDDATKEPSTNLDNLFSDEVIEGSKKRLNECETSLPSKKAKLDIEHKILLSKDVEKFDVASEQLQTDISKCNKDGKSSPPVLESSVQHSVLIPSGHDLVLASAQFLQESIIQSSDSFCVSSSIAALQSNSNNPASQSYSTSESLSIIPSCQSNVERIIEEVAKGNFERGFDADYYSSQKKLKIKMKDDPNTLLQPSHCNSSVFSTFTAISCQPYPQEHLYSHHAPGSVSQNAMADAKCNTSVPTHGSGQNASIAPELPSQSQNITIMTGSGLVQVSNNNIPSFQQLQMYSAGVAAARQLASSQMQQSLTVNPEMLPQHRPLGPQVRPSVDAAPIIFRPPTQNNSTASATTGVQQCQIQVQQHMFQQSSANTQSFHQRHSHSTEKMIPSNQTRLQVTDAVGSVSVQQNLLGQPVHSLQYQLRPSSSSAHIQIPCSSNNRQACNSFIQQQDLFNRSLVFRGQMKTDQQVFTIKESLPRQISPKTLDTSQQGAVRPSTSLATAQSMASNPQMLKGTNLTVTSSDANEGMQNISRTVLTKGDCRQQQLYIRPIMAMQQQQPLSSSSCMDQSSIMVGQHRMPFTIKEPRLSSNFSRAEPKTPGNTMQQPSLMLGVVGSAGQPVQNQSVSLESTTQQPAINLFPGLTSPPVGILGSAVLIPPQQQQLALEKSLLLNASVQQRMVQPAAVFQYAAPTQHVNLHHISNSSQLEFFVAGNRMVTPIIQALPPEPIINHGQQVQSSQGIHLSAHMSQSMIQQTRPNPENLDRGLAILAQKLPVVWQGLLALKNDSAHVQMHYVCGSKNLVQASLPDNVAPLRIAQRMRLEPTQLEQVTKRMNESDFSMLLAVPCGRDPVEIMTQSHNLQTFFIHYLQQKQAAGIVNILQPNSTQTAYVVHIFPPCDFSVNNLSRLPPDVVQNLVEGGYLLIIITTC